MRKIPTTLYEAVRIFRSLIEAIRVSQKIVSKKAEKELEKERSLLEWYVRTYPSFARGARRYLGKKRSIIINLYLNEKL